MEKIFHEYSGHIRMKAEIMLSGSENPPLVWEIK